jgi:putative membrane protein
MRRRQRPVLWKGALAGLAGGLAGAWVMTLFQSAWSKASERLRDDHQEHIPQERQQEPDSEDATMKAAGKLARAVTGRQLTREQKQKAGPVVHYAFGSSIGALYGVAAEVAPASRRVAGMPFGAAVFLGADEVAVPALGLSKRPGEYPLSTHAYGLASHLVYGFTTEMVRRALRRVL